MNINNIINKLINIPKGERKIKLKNYFKSNYQYFTKYLNNYKDLPYYSKNGANLNINYPLVSVLMPIYNHADMALKALDSIIKQSYKNIEIIILDDGSTDNLLEKLKYYYEKYPQIQVYSQKNQKLPRALTHLHKFAKGDFITWTSADNLMHKDNIKVLVEGLLKNPEAALVYSDIILIGENGKPYYKQSRDNERDRKYPKIVRLPQNETALSLEADNYINAAFLYRKQNSNLLKGIYADDFIGAEDYDYWLRLQKSGKLIHMRNQQPLYYYRVHENTMSFDLQKQEKIKKHIMRINNLLEYEKLRQAYCNQRFYIDVSKKISKENTDYLDRLLKKIACNSNLFGNKKPEKKSQIIEFGNNGNGIVIENKKYIILENAKRIIAEPLGVDISNLAIKARNIFSRNQFVYFLENIKMPIIGCHGNLANVDVNRTSNIISKNSKHYFIIIDIAENIKLKKELEKYKNVTYMSNLEYGIEYKIYSNFKFVISLPTNNDFELIYQSMILGWATGRNILHYDENLEIYPYTYKINDENILKIKIENKFNLEDYKIMDKYIAYFSSLETLERVLNYYKTCFQEKYISRPDNEIEIISISKPIKLFNTDNQKER